MKKLLATLLVLAFGATSYAQEKVREKDLIGQWELVIDVRDEIEEDIEDEDHWLARRFAKAVSNFALNIVEEIDIKMDFRANGEVKISVDVFGVHETEYAEWEINSRGELIIEGDWRDSRGRRSRRINIDTDDHDLWMMDGNKLIAYDRGYRGKLKKKDEVYMVKRR